MTRMPAWVRRLSWTSRHIYGRFYSIVRTQGISGIIQRVSHRSQGTKSGSEWLSTQAYQPAHLPTILNEISSFRSKPMFSLLVLNNGVEESAVQLTLDSIEQQIYRNYEVLYGGDLITSRSIPPNSIKNVASSDLDSVLQSAQGDFIALVQPGICLSPDLLFEAAKVLQTHPDIDLIYSDHDHWQTVSDRSDPVLKPDWSPDFLLSGDYIGSLKIFSREFLAKQAAAHFNLNVPQPGYALSLQLSRTPSRVHHIPRILYSCQMPSQGPTNPKVDLTPVLQNQIAREGLPAKIVEIPGRAHLAQLHYRQFEEELISIIICSHDQPNLLNACLDSIFQKTLYSNFEVVLIDHQSRLPATRKIIQKWKTLQPSRFLVESITAPFNYSALNNAGVKLSGGKYVLLLNNDTEVIHPDWLAEMAGWAQRPETGAVGACLLYPNDTIQHAGILLGMRDLAVHAFKGFPAGAAGYQGRLLVPSNFLALTGACLMMRRSLFDELGGLDEQFAVAGGDIDLCLRIYQKGLFNVLLPYVRLYHYESATRGFEDNPQKVARLKQEYDLLKKRWPAHALSDPFYHPAFTRVRGDFSL